MNRFKTFVITAKAENVLRVLQKLASLMTRRQLKINKMEVERSSVLKESFLMLVFQTEEKEAEWLTKQLSNFVDLFDLNIKMIHGG